jgi:hypothetical protein
MAGYFTGGRRLRAVVVSSIRIRVGLRHSGFPQNSAVSFFFRLASLLPFPLQFGKCVLIFSDDSSP